MSSSNQQPNTLDRLAERVDNIARPLRIMLNMAISLIVMGLLGVPIVLNYGR